MKTFKLAHISTKWVLFILPLLVIFLAKNARALTIDSVRGEIHNGKPSILIFLFEDVEPTKVALRQALTNTNNYEVSTGGANTDAVGSTATTRQIVPIKRVYFGIPGQEGVVNNEVLILELPSINYLTGTLTIRAIQADNETLDAYVTDWSIDDPQTYIPKPVAEFNLNLPEGRAVAAFNVSQTSKFLVNGSRVSRNWLKVEGNVPLTQPGDVSDTPGAKTDASRDVADYISASFARRTYDGNNITSLAMVARATGRLNSPEVVLQYQPLARFWSNGHGFLGAQSEFGVRDGTEEWKNLTTQAPNRGNVVARLAGVVEWAPQLGRINQDLGHGLRFYVRGRGWADYAKNDDGNNSVRFRPFIDSEFFYNVNDSTRVFLRHENGYLPPDLSERTGKTFVGVGTSF